MTEQKQSVRGKTARILSIGLVRGLLGFITGFLAGTLLVTVIRLILGLEAWSMTQPNLGFTEPAWVLGGIFGWLGFMLSVGVMDDWL